MRTWQQKFLVALSLGLTSLLIGGKANAWGHHYYHHWIYHSVSHAIFHHSTYRGSHHEAQPKFPDADALPNHKLTPGALNPAVTQETIGKTICRPGYTKTIRPPESYTERLKKISIRQYGYSDRRLSHYEFDHAVSLELGGAPRSPSNLWPEPHYTVGGWGSYTKDKLENRLHHLVCEGKVSLRQAQREEAGNWIAAYKKYIGPNP